MRKKDPSTREIIPLKHYQLYRTDFMIQSMMLCMTTHQDWLYNALRPDAYLILWFNNESSRIMVDFEEVSITRDTILFIRKDRVHILMDEHYEGITISFTENFFCKSAEDAVFLNNHILFRDSQQPRYIKVEEEDRVLRLLATLLMEENATTAPSETVNRNLIQHFMIAAARKLEPAEIPLNADRDRSYVTAFQQLLARDFRSVKMVHTYATALHITEKRLNAATAHITGKSPKQLIDEKIMLEARRMLTHTSQTTSEIAFELGFFEVSNFIKYFRKHEGTTPAAYRRQGVKVS